MSRHNPIRRWALMSAPLAIFAIAFAGVACGGSSERAAASIPGGVKTIFLSAVEYKGSAEASKEPVPATTLPAGGGYVLKQPAGDPPKWEVEAYAWAPGSFTVVEGDQVTLQIVGVNGGSHEAELKGHGKTFTVKRGAASTVAFTAGAPGIYDLVCKTHGPNMTAQMVVLPANN